MAATTGAKTPAPSSVGTVRLRVAPAAAIAHPFAAAPRTVNPAAKEGPGVAARPDSAPPTGTVARSCAP